MLTNDPIRQAMKQKCDTVKKSTTLDPSHVDKCKFSGHDSAEYGSGGPKAGGPSSHGPGTSGSGKSGY